MSEFAELIKEAMLGEEPMDLHPRVEALSASVAKYESRLKTVRWMSIFSVTFMTALLVVGVVGILRSDDATGMREIVLYAMLALFGMSGVGMIKMWFAMMMNDIGLRKELKRTQILILEQGGDRG